jgi:hypothetical protein
MQYIDMFPTPVYASVELDLRNKILPVAEDYVNLHGRPYRDQPNYISTYNVDTAGVKQKFDDRLEPLTDYIKSAAKKYFEDNQRPGYFEKLISLDLMDTLNPNAGKTRAAHERSGYTITRLSNVIDILYGRGIKKIIIIDLTCSVIRKKQQGVDGRLVRAIARHATPETPSPVKRETKRASIGGRINKTRKRYKK